MPLKLKTLWRHSLYFRGSRRTTKFLQQRNSYDHRNGGPSLTGKTLSESQTSLSEK